MEHKLSIPVETMGSLPSIQLQQKNRNRIQCNKFKKSEYPVEIMGSLLQD